MENFCKARREGTGPVFRNCATRVDFQDIPQPIRVKPSSEQLLKTFPKQNARKYRKLSPDYQYSTKPIAVSD